MTGYVTFWPALYLYIGGFTLTYVLFSFVASWPETLESKQIERI